MEFEVVDFERANEEYIFVEELVEMFSREYLTVTLSAVYQTVVPEISFETAMEILSMILPSGSAKFMFEKT